MFIYALLMLLLGSCLLISVVLLTRRLPRRYALPYALLTVGIITYIISLLVQVLVLRVLRSPLLSILPVGALTIGLLAGFAEELARFFGYQYLARSAETKPQALMIGLGHGFSETIYTGLLALGFGFSLLGYGTEHPDNLGVLLSGAIAEAANGLLPIVMHLALSWLVLQVFLRGQVYWLFLAIFFHSLVEITAVLLGPNDAWSVVVWRAVVAIMSLFILTQIKDVNSA